MHPLAVSDDAVLGQPPLGQDIRQSLPLLRYGSHEGGESVNTRTQRKNPHRMLCKGLRVLYPSYEEFLSYDFRKNNTEFLQKILINSTRPQRKDILLFQGGLPRPRVLGVQLSR